jgi:hypothetical protein
VVAAPGSLERVALAQARRDLLGRLGEGTQAIRHAAHPAPGVDRQMTGPRLRPHEGVRDGGAKWQK